MTVKRTSSPVQGRVYLLEPGDATRYSFTLLPLSPNATKTYQWSDVKAFFLAIHLAYDLVGCGIVPVAASSAEELPNQLEYLRSPGHGFSHVDKYTLAMCILMSHVLMVAEYHVDHACAYAMAHVHEVLNKA
jgi:hypothetical protein